MVEMGMASSYGLPCPLNWKSITFSKMFLLIHAPYKNDLDTNDTSFESPIKGLLKAG